MLEEVESAEMSRDSCEHNIADHLHPPTVDSTEQRLRSTGQWVERTIRREGARGTCPTCPYSAWEEGACGTVEVKERALRVD